MAQIDTRQLDIAISPVTKGQRHRAARHVASNALDATDALVLLDMLGLMEDLEATDE